MSILKRFIALVLLVGVISNCLNYILIEEGYRFNKSYISSVLCTNKAKIGLHCEGKCFLDIKLKELEEKNKQEQQQIKRTVENFTKQVVTLPTPFTEELSKGHPTFYGARKPVNINVSIFQPPRSA